MSQTSYQAALPRDIRYRNIVLKIRYFVKGIAIPLTYYQTLPLLLQLDTEPFSARLQLLVTQ